MAALAALRPKPEFPCPRQEPARWLFLGEKATVGACHWVQLFWFCSNVAARPEWLSPNPPGPQSCSDRRRVPRGRSAPHSHNLHARALAHPAAAIWPLPFHPSILEQERKPALRPGSLPLLQALCLRPAVLPHDLSRRRHAAWQLGSRLQARGAASGARPLDSSRPATVA